MGSSLQGSLGQKGRSKDFCQHAEAAQAFVDHLPLGGMPGNPGGVAEEVNGAAGGAQVVCHLSSQALVFCFVLNCVLFSLRVCVHIMRCVPGSLRDQERESDSLRLELQTVLSHCVCVGNEHPVCHVLCKKNQYSEPLSHPALFTYFFFFFF